MAAPTFFGVAVNPADNGATNEPTTLAVTPPGSMVAGDLVILMGWQRSTSSASMTLNELSGHTWDVVGQVAQNTSGFNVWWTTFKGTWGADPSVGFAAQGGTITSHAGMIVFRSANAVKAVWTICNAFRGDAEALASPKVITGITAARPDNVTLAGWLITNISTWGTLAGTNWVNTSLGAQYRNTAGSDTSATFAYQLQAAAAATNDVSEIPSVDTTGCSFIISFASAPTEAVCTEADCTAAPYEAVSY